MVHEGRDVNVAIKLYISPMSPKRNSSRVVKRICLTELHGKCSIRTSVFCHHIAMK